MPIEKFKLMNDDGSLNKSEYDRCVAFLNSYVEGSVKVYRKPTWTNQLEVDMTQPLSAFTILNNLLNLPENHLLTKDAFNSIVKCLKGMITRQGSTIHTYGRYLENSANLIDGPGYMYDVLTKDETRVSKEVVNDTLNIYYLNDDNHTVLEYNDELYSQLNARYFPTHNFPDNPDVDPDTLRVIESNVDSYPNVYKGNLSGIYSDFYRTAGQYIGSSTLFYYSECNDELYTTGAKSFEDSTTGQIINFKYKANVYTKSRPTAGVEASLAETMQNNIMNVDRTNAYIAPEVIETLDINYLSPSVTFTAADENEWNL